MNKLVQGVIAGVVGLGLVGVTETSAAAMGPEYSAARSNSVRLVWRYRMGHYYYHTDQGARYSEHLGVRYSQNAMTDHVTWVTDAHEKLYNRDTGVDDIYYHVHSRDDDMAGWIWRGYLVPGHAKGVELTTQEIERSAARKSVAAPTPVPAQPVQPQDTTALAAIQGLGHGATPDPTEMRLARRLLTQAIALPFKTAGQIDGERPNPDELSETSIIESLFDNRGPWYSPQVAEEYPNDAPFKALMTRNGLTNFGYGPGKVDVLYFSTCDPEITYQSMLADYFGSNPANFGHDGLTSTNFYTGVRIGYATQQVTSTRYAAFAVVAYPSAKYGHLFFGNDVN